MSDLGKKWINDVREFHEAMGVPVVDEFTPKQAGLRCALIAEETCEVREAYRAFDLVSIADGLVDLAYVVVGVPAQLGRDYVIDTTKATTSGRRQAAWRGLRNVLVGTMVERSSALLGELMDGCKDPFTEQSVFSLMRWILNASQASSLPFVELWDEVHAANMRKAGGPKCPTTGKQLKPEGWVGPDIAGVLKRNGLIP